MNPDIEWICLGDALAHLTLSAGSIYLSRIYLQTALGDGRVRSQAKCAFIKRGALPKEMIGEAAIPAWFWKHARINWDNLNAPAIHKITVVNGLQTQRLPYFEAHVISVCNEDLLRYWPRIEATSGASTAIDEAGYASADRVLYAEIEEILRTGRARGANGAAKLLVDRIAGSGVPASRAKRLSDRFNRERRRPP